MTPAQAETRARAAKGDGDLLREELLDAAERLLVENGSVDAVSVRAIATRVGVTPPSLYLHFADKDELFVAVCSRRFEEFGAQMLAAIDGVDGHAERFAALGEAYIEYGLSHPEHYEVLFGSGADVLMARVDDPSELPGVQAFEVLVDVIAQGTEAGEFVAADARNAAVAAWAQVHGFVALAARADCYAGEAIDVLAARETVLRQALDGLRPR